MKNQYDKIITVKKRFKKQSFLSRTQESFDNQKNKFIKQFNFLIFNNNKYFL